MKEITFISTYELKQDGIQHTLNLWQEAQYRDEHEMTENDMEKVEIKGMVCYIKPSSCKPNPPNKLLQALCDNKCLRDLLFLDFKTHGITSYIA